MVEAAAGSLRRHAARRPWLVVLLVSTVFLLFGLDRSPMILIEETFYSAPAYDLVRFGRFSSSILGASRGTNEAYLLNMPLHPLILAGAYRLFGFDIWTTRLVSLFPLLVSGLLAYGLVVRGTGEKRAGIAAMLLLISDTQLVAGARGGRPDALMVMFFVAAFCLALASGGQTGRTRRWTAAGAGFLSSLSFLSHIAGILALIAAGCALLTQDRTQDAADHRVLLDMLAGFLAPLVPYGVYAWIHSAAFWDQIVASVAKYSWNEGRSGGFVTRGIRNVFVEFRRAPLTGVLYFAIPLLVLFHIARGRVPRGMAAAAVAWVVVLPITVLLFPMPHHQIPGEVLVFMACGYAVSTFAWGISSRVRQGLVVLVAAAVVWQMGVAWAGKAATVAANWTGRDPGIPERLIRKHVPEGAVVIGAPEVFYATLGQNRGFYLPIRDPVPEARFEFVVTNNESPPPKEWVKASEIWSLLAAEERKGWRFSDNVPWFRLVDSPSEPVYRLYLWRRTPLA